VCLLPEFLILKYNVPFYFGGTSLLIIVVVTMDFMAQVQNYMMSQQYESLLKKGEFQGDVERLSVSRRKAALGGVKNDEGDRCRAVDDLRVSVQYGERPRRRLSQGRKLCFLQSSRDGWKVLGE
jgi:hypothetical protein